MRRAAALALSTHPVPGLGVTAVTVLLGIGAGLEPWRVALLGVAMAADQASVGLSNDWIDAERDRAVGRTDKPVARGDVPASAVRTAAFVTLALALLLTVPLGVGALVAHAVFLAGAWCYNAGLKKTALSALPYATSFGTLPAVVTLSAAEPAPPAWWAVAAGALLGVAAHFANVLPDLDDDRATGVRGLPHRLGRRTTAVLLPVALVAVGSLVVLGPGRAPTALGAVALGVTVVAGVAGAVLALRRDPGPWLFRLVIAAALVDVLLLAFSGGIAAP